MLFIIFITLSICSNYKSNKSLSEHDYSKTSMKHYLDKDHTYSNEKGYYDNIRKVKEDPCKYLSSMSSKDKSFQIADKYLKDNKFESNRANRLPVLSKDDLKYIKR